MRVLWVDTLAELGGAQISMLEVIRQLKLAGVEVLAAVPPGPLFEQLQAAGIEVYPLSAIRASRKGWGLVKTAARLLRIPSSVYEIVRSVKPDIIHANSMAALLAVRRHVTKVPVILHVRDLRLPELLLRQAARQATRLLAVSQAVDEYLAEVISPRSFSIVRIINNGIVTEKYANLKGEPVRERLGIPPTVPVVGMIAHIAPWKRHAAFVRAAALIKQQFPAAHFVLAGRDLFNDHQALVGEIRELIKSGGFGDSFHWLETCDDASEILPAFNVLLHPAVGEPFGRAVCEAMAAAVPVVAVASGGPSYLIEHNVTGILSRATDAASLAQAAGALLADAPRRAVMGQAAQKRAATHYDITLLSKALVREYAAVLAEFQREHSQN